LAFAAGDRQSLDEFDQRGAALAFGRAPGKQGGRRTCPAPVASTVLTRDRAAGVNPNSLAYRTMSLAACRIVKNNGFCITLR
jgi:hypothetical protein